MKTTHQLAKELLAMDDVPLVIEGWCSYGGQEIIAKMTGYDPEGTAILVLGDCPPPLDEPVPPPRNSVYKWKETEAWKASQRSAVHGEKP